jgi:hypothetical protein
VEALPCEYPASEYSTRGTVSVLLIPKNDDGNTVQLRYSSGETALRSSTCDRFLSICGTPRPDSNIHPEKGAYLICKIKPQKADKKSSFVGHTWTATAPDNLL